METEINLAVYSPLSGIVTPLSEVPDPVFAEKMLGDGLAVNPQDNFVCAPFDGVVKTLHKAFHALVIEAAGVEVLIHIGVETVNMKGEGFKAFVSVGQQVKKGDRLIQFDRDLISQKAASNLVIVIVSNKPEIELKKTALSDISAGQLLFSLGAPAITESVPAPAAPLGDFSLSDTICVQNKNGFHARPAALIAKLASTFEGTDVQIIKETQRASAKSMVEIMGLSIDYKDCIQVAAAGPDKDRALKEITTAIIKGLNEGGNTFLPASKSKPDFSKEAELYGISVFPGIVIGKAFIMNKEEIKVEESAPDAKAEEQKLITAVEGVRAALKKEIEQSVNQKNKHEILSAHLTMLEDPFLLETAESIVKEGKSAGFSWKAAIKKSIEVLNATGNRFLQERIDDYKDAEARVLFELTGKKYDVPDFPPGTIVVVKDLLSYELSFLNENVIGVAMALGSSTSHISIMLKNMGMASIIALGEDIMDIPHGADIILNSELGIVTVNPGNIDEVRQKQQQREAARELNLKHAFEEAKTKDGTVITIEGNVGSLLEAEAAASRGSEGLGLVRTEFLFADSHSAPSEEEQYELYQKIVNTQSGKKVIIRTLDVGGDKPLSYVPIPDEENPIMGMRGVRNYKLNMELFRSQIRAIMRVTPHGTAQIMLPMISFVDELLVYKEIILREQKKLGIDKVNIGIMVEVPSAAIMAGEFSKHVDFFSIGTNDLTQYTLAIDRGHTTLSPLADTLNPAVLKLIEVTAQGAAKNKKPVGVCGSVASDFPAIPLLIGFGIRDLSVVSSLIPDVKAFIRTLDIKDCQNLAALSLTMQEARQIRELVKSKYNL